MKRLVLVLAGAFLLSRPHLVWAQEEVPEPARPFLEEAERMKSAGRVEDAVKSYRRAIDAASAFIPSYVSLGAFLAEQGKADEALAVFEAGLKSAPKNQTLLFNAAAVSLKVARFPVALAYADRAVAESPREPSLHLLRGSVLRKMGRNEDALSAYKEAARLDPRSAQTQFNLGSVYHDLNRPAEAADAFKAAFERDPTLLKAQYNLGAVLFEMGRDEEALRAYEMALAPFDKELSKGKSVESIHARAFANLGALYLRRREWQKSLSAYEKAARIDPGGASQDYDLGYLHYQLGHVEKAAELYGKALAKNPSLPLAHLHLGLMAERNNRPEAAKRSLEASLPLADKEGRREAHLALARLAVKKGESATAEASLRAVLKDFPEEGSALLALGRLERRQGRLADARTTLERARSALADNGSVVRELAALARAEGDSASEKKLYEELLARPGKPDGVWALRLRIAFLALNDAGRPTGTSAKPSSEVRQALEAALAHVPPSKAEAGRSLRSLLALALASEGKRDEAAQSLAKVSAERPGDGPTRLAAAALDAAAGRVEPARGALAKASPQPPESSAAQREARATIDRYREANLALLSWSAGRTPTDADVALLRWAYPTWWGVNVAEGERALERRDDRVAARKLSAALEACAAGPGAATPAATAVEASTAPGVFRVVVGGGALSPSLCERARTLDGVALVRSSLSLLGEAKSSGTAAKEARAQADRALLLPLDPAGRAAALYARGTADLFLGKADSAQESLAAALGEKLPSQLVPFARNNLAVALARAGSFDSATRELQAARGAAPHPAEATLNLGVLRDQGGHGAEALALYDEYLQSETGGSPEIAERADALRKAYP